MSNSTYNVVLQHSMKVVFLCNRLSRTRLRPGGSWQALLEGREGTQEISFRPGTPNLLSIQPAQQQQEVSSNSSRVHQKYSPCLEICARALCGLGPMCRGAVCH